MYGWSSKLTKDTQGNIYILKMVACQGGSRVIDTGEEDRSDDGEAGSIVKNC